MSTPAGDNQLLLRSLTVVSLSSTTDLQSVQARLDTGTPLLVVTSRRVRGQERVELETALLDLVGTAGAWTAVVDPDVSAGATFRIRALIRRLLGSQPYLVVPRELASPSIQWGLASGKRGEFVSSYGVSTTLRQGED